MQPTRTCVGCRARSVKADMFRVVRTAAGVELDLSGTAPGRGAYVHRRGSCVSAATSDGVLARALRTALGQDELGRLREQMETGAL